MASISTLEASSSASNPHSNYEVFLSFRGEDTRKNFTDHLYNTLVAYGIHTFRDDEELEKGEDIKSGLSRAIQGSKIFIIIFSKNYATSKWCLNELVKIMEHTTPEDSKVVPIFYHVKPSDVGQQSGSFEDSFLNHEKDANQEKKEMIKKWRTALEKAAKLSGYHVDNQHEADIIQQIREVIIRKLNCKPLHVGDNIVGIDFHLKQLKSLIKIELDDVHMVGIYGIGGIGKTTIAMAIYNDISSQFDGSSFLRGVGEKSKGGILELQKKLLKDTLKGQSPEFKDPSEGINVIKERLCSKRILIVLDDVDEIEQLENLAGKHGWYGAKSRIIITTKDTNLLNQHGVDQFYEVKELNNEEAIELFNWWAFKQNIPRPKEDFESLSNCVVKYAKGLPIALKVLGGFLFGKSIDEWKSALHKLEKIPHMKVQSVLKVSYERLDDVEKEIFLDIACFFKGKDKDFVSRILGRCAEIGIKVLHEKCLITISKNKLDMHDLLQQMGHEIVRQECLKEPGKRSRLWDPNDVNSVLTRNTGTQAIEGLFVEISTSNRIQFSTDFFIKLNRLRLLKVYYQLLWNDFKVDLPMDLEFPSFELRYLHFEKYPLASLPTNFHAKNLVELNLRFSRIKKLWKGNEILDNLKIINLSNSKDLIEIPDFSRVPNLEILILKGCRSLESLPRNFHKLEHLRSLSCASCPKLKSFPAIKGNMSKLREINLSGTAIIEVPSSIEHLNGLEDFNLSLINNLEILPKTICSLSSLKILRLYDSSNLKGFPEIKDEMEKLERLDLRSTAIEELPSSIGNLMGLKHLNLSYCKNLVNLPESICNLRSLQSLTVQGCFKLKGFPKIKDGMKNLERLDLRSTAIEELSSSIGNLKTLKCLHLSYCKNLVNLPKSVCNLRSLETLSVQGCFKVNEFPEIKDDTKNLERLDLSSTTIEELPSSIGNLKALKHLNLSYCKNLVNLPKSICNLRSLETLSVKGCFKLRGFPEIKNDMENLEMLNLSETSIEKLSSSIGNLKALKDLNLSCCKNLVNLPKSICNLRSLQTLEVQDCPKLERLEVNLSFLRSLTLTCHILKQGVVWSNDHFSSLKALNLQCNQIEGEILNHHIWPFSSLVVLSIRNSKHMERGILNDGFHLSSLEVVSVGNFNLMEGGILSGFFYQSSLESLSLRNCNLMKEVIPTDIWNLSSLVNLSLSNCNLMEGEILNHICYLSTLESLSLDGNHFNSIPAGISRLSNLRLLDFSHCKKLQEIPELPSSLNYLDLRFCQKLQEIPELPSSLRCLYLSHCQKLQEIPALPSNICYLELKFCKKLREIPELPLSLRNFDLSHCKKLQDVPELPSSLLGLDLSHCKKLQKIPKLPSSLENLDLSHCKKLQKIPELPSSLESLDLSHCKKLQEISKLPPHLRDLNLSHCKKLQEIPALPSSLRLLDAHCSAGISSLPSLVNFFKSELVQGSRTSMGACNFRGRGNSIVIPKSSGILEGIRNQSMGCNGVKTELPHNWYEDDDLLGFALCCVYVPVVNDEFDNGSDCESENEASSWFSCQLTIWRNNQSANVGILSYAVLCDRCDDDTVSDLVWVIYYPKVAIKEQYRSNQWTHFMATFNYTGDRTLKAEECGIHLIYANSSCFNCYRNKECQQKLCLEGKGINELPFIVSPFQLGSLCLRECKKLEYLPSTICELKSLTTLSCSGCSQLKIFPEILQTLENLRELHLDGTAIEELPASIQHLRGLQYLNMAYCNNLVSLPQTICHLKSLVFLSFSCCPQLKSFPEILENMENLRKLYLDGTAIKELSVSIQHLRGLQDLDLSNCSNLVNLPESICNLTCLKYFNVGFCPKLEKFSENLGSLQCLEGLGVAGFDSNQVLGAIQSHVCYKSSWEPSNLCINYFSSIPTSIIQFSKLRILDLSHCQKLLQIPELPPSLRLLDVHACPCLETLSSPSSLLGFSLFKCFKSAIEEFECASNTCPGIRIVIPVNNGIPEWIRQQKKGSEITIELPMDWYQNNDFLGFALYSVHVPLHIKSKEDPCSLKCKLTFHGHPYEFLDEFRDWYSCCCNGGESNQALVTYYPKVAINNEYFSNKWRYLKASFHGKRVRVEECGFHLIYMPKIFNRTNIPQDTKIKGVKHNHTPTIQYLDVQRSNGETLSTDHHNYSPMDTMTQNVEDNVIDAQDDEEDHMQKWLELLCKLVQWVCCRRY